MRPNPQGGLKTLKNKIIGVLKRIDNEVFRKLKVKKRMSQFLKYRKQIKYLQ